jgi:hypothetical protein
LVGKNSELLQDHCAKKKKEQELKAARIETIFDKINETLKV